MLSRCQRPGRWEQRRPVFPLGSVVCQRVLAAGPQKPPRWLIPGCIAAATVSTATLAARPVARRGQQPETLAAPASPGWVESVIRRQPKPQWLMLDFDLLEYRCCAFHMCTRLRTLQFSSTRRMLLKLLRSTLNRRAL